MEFARYNILLFNVYSYNTILYRRIHFMAKDKTKYVGERYESKHGKYEII